MTKIAHRTDKLDCVGTANRLAVGSMDNHNGPDAVVVVCDSDLECISIKGRHLMFAPQFIEETIDAVHTNGD